MDSVGIRRLKDALGEYLAKVRGGQTVLVTDRGVPVAKIIPVSISKEMSRLMSEGRVTWSGKSFVPPPRPVRPKAGAPLASDLISRDRD